MADHTLLHGVQAALDRRLRSRALDLQAQGMQMQDEDRDQRERDMQRRIIDQHNLNSAKLAAESAKPRRYETPEERSKRELGNINAKGQYDVERADTTGRYGVEKAGTTGRYGVEREETRSDAMVGVNKGHDDTRVKVEKMGIDAGKYDKAPRGGGIGSSIPPADKAIMEREKTIASLVKSINSGDWGQAAKFVPAGMRSDQSAIKAHLEELKKVQEAAIKARDGQKSASPSSANNPP